MRFYLLKRPGNSAWRAIHGLSYLFFGTAFVRGLFSGTDSGSPWATILYWFTAVSLAPLTAYRLVLARQGQQEKACRSFRPQAAHSVSLRGARAKPAWRSVTGGSHTALNSGQSNH